MKDDADDVPAALAIAWARVQPPTRGPRAGLSAEAIVTAAIELADAEGLAALSMGRVAGRLGCSAMALYRHVGSKDDLLALVQDAALGEPPSRPATGWRDALAAWARDILAAYGAHLWVLDIPISGPPAMPRQIAWLEQALRALEATTLALDERLSVALLVSGYSRTWAQLARDLERGRERAGQTTGEVADRYRDLLVRLVPDDRFPAVGAAVRAGLFGDDATDAQVAVDFDTVEFEFGLARILDGIEAYIGRAG